MLWIMLSVGKVQLYPLLFPISHLTHTYNHVFVVQCNISSSQMSVTSPISPPSGLNKMNADEMTHNFELRLWRKALLGTWRKLCRKVDLLKLSHLRRPMSATLNTCCGSITISPDISHGNAMILEKKAQAPLPEVPRAAKRVWTGSLIATRRANYAP
jgi:hypothetical protein